MKRAELRPPKRVPEIVSSRSAGAVAALAAGGVALAAVLLAAGARSQLSHRPVPPGPWTAGQTGAAPREALDTSFSRPERVSIAGYAGDAMEPFVSRDGSVLLFNDRNEPPNDTKLHWAERVDDVTYRYRGLVEGVNTPAIEGTPSLDRDGNLYFVSTRSYGDTLSTIYRGRWNAGAVSDVALVPGTSRLVPGWVGFDVEVSADGETLVLSDGLYDAGGGPRSASLILARRAGAGFERLADQSALANLAWDGLTYAAGLSASGRELFFTRMAPALFAQPSIWVATRPAADAPFGPPRRIAAVTGFVEAPTLSPDGLSLYYHRRDGDRFVLERVTRPAPGP